MMVIEHELPGFSPNHPPQQRWAYFYPLLTTLAAAGYLTLAVRPVRRPWAATLTAALFMLLRLPPWASSPPRASAPSLSWRRP